MFQKIILLNNSEEIFLKKKKSKKGYTSLDYLCKYKEDNESQLSAEDIELYNEIYDMMLTSIRGYYFTMFK